jgi:preprotein translocase subunit SecD
MARSSARPGRTVAVFFIGLAVAYGLVALVGTWKPALGLDLEGGTQITLTATGSVSKDNLNQAADIIDARVNGSGVSEAAVTTQGNNEIVVQVPGSTKNSLVQTVIRQARLRFRLVAQVTPTTTPQTPAPSSGTSPSPSPGVGVTLPPSTKSTTSTMAPD